MIVEQPLSSSFRLGSRVNLSCLAKAVPVPDYAWLLEGVLIQDAPPLSVYSFDLTPEVRGAYSCRATNPLGTADSSDAFISLSGMWESGRGEGRERGGGKGGRKGERREWREEGGRRGGRERGRRWERREGEEKEGREGRFVVH